ncbi:MAG TPA: GspMb/PilO family protein [Candidatus Acidoferrales bacterium]|nr:GspMb/PilO family protein [Candidatus Acidoferrales bacterium]
MGVVLALVLAADLALAGFLWRASYQEPLSLRGQRDLLALQAKKLKADVDRGDKIRASLPQVGKDCDAFYQQSFLDSPTGYSRIESDLGEIATKSGVKISGYTFKQRQLKNRGVTEIQITTDVDADYPAVIQFINGLERSKNFYLLDSLHLTSVSTGGIRLDLDLHTYFRT